MFWKKKQKAKKRTEEPFLPIMKLIEQLSPGQSVTYRVAEVYGGDLAIVELNPRYPDKGKKYSMYTEELVDGKPSGRKVRIWDSDKPEGIAKWVVNRNGVPFGRP